MSSDVPLTIGMPVYNGERYIGGAIESLLAQTYGDFRLVIGDNASTDATEEICRKYAAADGRVLYFRHERNLGAADNHNFVFGRGEGEFFKWAAYDDLCAPSFVSKCIESLNEFGPSVVAAYSQAKFINDDGDLLATDTSSEPCDASTPSRRLAQLILTDRERTILHWCLPIYGVFRRRPMQKTGLIGRFNKSDTILLVEMALRGSFYEVPEVLFYNRKHSASSQVANATTAQIAAWFDPALGRYSPMVRSRLFGGYVASVVRAQIPMRERLKCGRVLASKLAANSEWRKIGGEFKMRAREVAERTVAHP